MFQDTEPALETLTANLASSVPSWANLFGGYFLELVQENTLADYLVAGIAGAIVLAITFGIKFGLLALLKGGIDPNDGVLTRREIIASAVSRTWLLFLLLVAVLAASSFLTLPDGVVASLKVLTVITFFLQVAVWASTLLAGLTERYLTLHGDTDPQATTGLSLVRLIGRGVIWSIALLMILDNLGVDVTALVAGLGIGGIAIGLAAQNILGDLFGSLAIVMDKPFVRGDFIILSPDHMGNVEQIGLKTTRIRSLSGEQLVVANSDLLSSRIRNYKRMYERRIVFKLGTTYDTPREKIELIPVIMREAIEEQDDARFDRAHFAAYGDFALIFEGVWFVRTPDYTKYMDVQQAIYLKIHERFEAEGIEFAFPTQTIHLQHVGGASAEQPAAS